MKTSHCHACRGLLPTSQYAPAGPAIPRRLKMPGEKPFLRSRTALGRYQLLFCGIQLLQHRRDSANMCVGQTPTLDVEPYPRPKVAGQCNRASRTWSSKAVAASLYHDPAAEAGAEKK
jgi:hypothetical protein